VALAWIVVYPLVMAWMARDALRELEMGWRTLRDELRPVVVASLMMAGIVVIARWALPASDVAEQLVRLGLTVALGGAAYAAAIVWQGGALVGEMGEVVGWLARPLQSSRRASAGERA
jgi:hypothetical protein